ncbi:Transmembrane protein [Trema orientale]|uniref:Transmembrane protein n=1 Tax=Trema orientale TaxID=63057 RepID=A0A2P5E7C2_TREOI|nr:Transmembrane protein [Trema orientale]
MHRYCGKAPCTWKKKKKKKKEGDRDREREMTISLTRRSLQLSPLLFSLFMLIVSGLAGASDPSNSKSVSKSSSAGIKVLIICVGLVAVIGFSVLLFKLWQKKKRAEQHARLLKLFEDDDELEVELGIRD